MADYVSKDQLGAVLRGEERPPFPHVIDNTTRCSFVKCGRSWLYEHLLHRVGRASNIHLIAGAAFAEGIDRFYKSFYTEDTPYTGDFDTAFIEGFLGLTKEYGVDLDRERSEEWKKSPKSWQRMVEALRSYWQEYNPKFAQSKICMVEGKPCAEQSFSVPLPINHPVTGDPLLYHGRFDAIIERAAKQWGQDDKTTTSMGAAWANSWDARSQFMGYVWGAQTYGWDLSGVIVRGTCILKGSIKHMEVPISFPPHLIQRWYDQLLKDVIMMVETWRHGEYGYNFSDSCTAYGGCSYRDICLAKHQTGVLGMMPIRIWNPMAPSESRIIVEKDT